MTTTIRAKQKMSGGSPPVWFDAVNSGDADSLKTLLKQSPTCVGVRYNDWTALGLSLCRRSLPCVQALIGLADVEQEFLMQRRLGDGFFPLKWAIMHNMVEALAMLVKAGANVDRAFASSADNYHEFTAVTYCGAYLTSSVVGLVVSKAFFFFFLSLVCFVLFCRGQGEEGFAATAATSGYGTQVP